MKYFWKQYEDLPDGLGYGRFSTEHILTLIAAAAIIILLVYWFSKSTDKGRKRFLTVIPLLMVVMECFKDSFLAVSGHFGVGYLPLHLCSLGVFIFLLYLASKTDKWKSVFSEIALTLILPGSIAALLFPDWAHLYPVFNFMNLYGYAWHTLLVVYPLLMMKNGDSDLSIRHFHYDCLFLLVVVPPVYLFDKRFDCNYMFVNRPPKGTPLELVYNITGDTWYLLGYVVFAVLVILVIYTVISIFKKGKG